MLVFRTCDVLGQRVPPPAQEALTIAHAYQRGEATPEQLTSARVKLWTLCQREEPANPALRIVICALMPDDEGTDAFDNAYYVLGWAEALGVSKVEQERLLEETVVTSD